MHSFVVYSLLASALWGVMSITEAYVGGKYDQIAFLLKLLVFGLVGVGVAVAAALRGRFEPIANQLRQIAHERPGLLAWLVAVIVLGAFGTMLAYKAYARCGKNRGVTVAITYGAPLIVVTAISAVVLKERLGRGGFVGILLIMLGIYVIDRYGVDTGN